MQERITFVHGPEDPFDPKQLSLRDDTLHVQSLKAAREDRVTLSLYELPQEVQIARLHPRTILMMVDLESLEAMLRAAYTMGISETVYGNSAFCVDPSSWIAYFLHSPTRPPCVRKGSRRLVKV